MSFYNKLNDLTTTNQTATITTTSTNFPLKATKVVKSAKNDINIDSITADNLPLDFVKKYLRVEHDLDDVEILIHIRSAQSYVKTYIKQPDEEPMDIGLLQPVLALVAYFYENKTPQMKSTEKLDTVFGTILNMHIKEIL